MAETFYGVMRRAEALNLPGRTQQAETMRGGASKGLRVKFGTGPGGPFQRLMSAFLEFSTLRDKGAGRGHVDRTIFIRRTAQ